VNVRRLSARLIPVLIVLLSGAGAFQDGAETAGARGTLREVAQARAFLVGAAVFPEGLNEEAYATLLAREFNALTPENVMKWEMIHPRPGEWNFEPADRLIEFATRHQMKVTAHTLVWHMQLPEHVKALSPDSLRQALDEHIRTVVARYRGKVYAWDVVNEALDDEGGLRKTVFLEKLGPTYIIDAFRAAHEADPDALLFYNDYGCEGLGAKSDLQFALLQRLLERGVPVGGVGLQMHISPLDCPPPEDIAANVRRLVGLGLRVHISEMDVRIRDLRRPWFASLDPLQVQADTYREVLAACTAEKGFDGVTFWGLTDKHSWFNQPVEMDRPLLFDTQYRPKPAYDAVRGAIFGK
jgi:endo-1,4-beta-xylanase